MIRISEDSSFKSRSAAKLCIERYFSSKNSFEVCLLDDKYVDLCISTDMCSGADKAYEAIGKSSFFENSDDGFCPIEKDVKFVIKILDGMKRIVPQEFSPGILLMHLEVIENMPI